ncbi:hypothetical protein OGAPHI_002386 [Ogataea philodendri]|uniref:Uncharacterized protein n=1 Tax=Ogataea philodendri TaxID=1378263 RepID=A0A9P8PB57_9ASCO|nr:uncharacterized protein OGAPHI_002386 [Ogataea philodendri]KAH3668632.1 hypothetical protein OGAPHI_002386 [Ogataea philodendri]
MDFNEFVQKNGISQRVARLYFAGQSDLPDQPVLKLETFMKPKKTPSLENPVPFTADLLESITKSSKFEMAVFASSKSSNMMLQSEEDTKPSSEYFYPSSPYWEIADAFSKPEQEEEFDFCESSMFESIADSEP